MPWAWRQKKKAQAVDGLRVREKSDSGFAAGAQRKDRGAQCNQGIRSWFRDNYQLAPNFTAREGGAVQVRIAQASEDVGFLSGRDRRCAREETTVPGGTRQRERYHDSSVGIDTRWSMNMARCGVKAAVTDAVGQQITRDRDRGHSSRQARVGCWAFVRAA